MKRISIVQVGLGTIGGTVVEQIVANQAMWRERDGLDVTVAGILTTRGALVAGPDGIEPGLLREIVTRRRAGSDLPAIGQELSIRCVDSIDFDLNRLNLDRPIVMDAAAGIATSDLGVQAIDASGGVVYSNKAPLAQDQSVASAGRLWDGARTGTVRYETTCGAGLPVISTITSLLGTGDEVTGIVGCLSGTLGAIFSDIAQGEPFSRAIASAKEAGYTEPDPRDDLSGLDVARKALILARTIGRRVDLGDIAVESLVPDSLADCSVATFLERIVDHDGPMADRHASAERDGMALKYVATVPSDGPIRVGIEAVPRTTVLGALQGPENIISIRTRRYDRYPLTVSGPGAGADVTAAGMIADMLLLAKAG